VQGLGQGDRDAKERCERVRKTHREGGQ
jgi:hypothetical protein